MIKKIYSKQDGNLKYLKFQVEVLDSFRNGIITGISEENWDKFFKTEDFKIQLLDFFEETDLIPRLRKGDKIEITMKVIS